MEDKQLTEAEIKQIFLEAIFEDEDWDLLEDYDLNKENKKK